MLFGKRQPAVTVQQLGEKLKSVDNFVLLDVREQDELDRARISDRRVVACPLTSLSTQGIDALPESARPKDAEIYVICHSGARSAQVVGWLANQGWVNILNVSGGIDAYARHVDPSVGRY